MSDVITRDEAYRKLAARCTTKECCVSEIREKLHNWNIQRVDEDSIIEQLLSERYIDEARYCRAFASDQFRFAGWGRIKIGYTLRQKQIDTLTVSQAVQEIDEEEYIESLRKILKSKLKGLKSLPERVLSEKLMRFALSRGFEPTLIRDCLKEMSLECTASVEI